MKTNPENRPQTDGTPPPSPVQAWLNTLPDDERAELHTTWDLAETARGPEDNADTVQTALLAFWDTVDDRSAAPAPRPDRPARPRAATRRLPSLVRSALVALLIGVGFALGWASGAGVFTSGGENAEAEFMVCLLYTSPSPRDRTRSRMPSSA